MNTSTNVRHKKIGILKIPLMYARKYAVIIAIQKILEGIVPTLQILATAKFLDTAIAILDKNKNFNDIFIPLGLVMLLLIYSLMSQKLVKFIEVKLEMELREKLRVSITEKRAKLKYSHVENNCTWDLISRVSKDPEIRFKDAYNELLSMVAMFIRIIGLLFVIFIHAWWAAIIILLISVPLFKVALKNGTDSYGADREVSKYRRRFEYLGKVLTGRESAEERTLFGYSKEINDKWKEQYEIARKIEYKTVLKNVIRTRIRGIITAIISIVIIIILLKPVQMESLSIGLFISIANGVFELIQLMSWQFTYYIEELAKNKEYVVDFNEFYSLDETEGAIDKPSKENIDFDCLEFKDVSFKYPKTNNYILKNLSFVIKKGGHYSFVGVNGAGKTTITKLITGLYDNFEGQIFINGKDIREYKQSELKSFCSVVYQDFAKYFISFRDNIALGDINNIENNNMKDKVKSSMRIMGLYDVAEKLRNGIETQLGKIKENGVDLSGGQWQRIGMARAINNNAPIRILDEPTASLDPISESNIYEHFEEISKGGTTIFISHRLGSTKLASEIFVIGNGTIIEKGSHEELMKLRGIYADMYESQRSWYL
ncbi:ABC transporter ATP-binding protein [Senegalia massiliensis]|uniref:ABC transporter ATP-binding protein n=1 Tax=Senegalia massiliensis TaxID=1720316 RepID=UPI001030A0A6|nr:ABC transporter ATP-binding protein [Senegalia massiliensis]